MKKSTSCGMREQAFALTLNTSVPIRWTVVLAAAMVAAVLLCCCSKKSVDGDRSFAIEATVIDHGTSSPVDSAKVESFQSGTTFDPIFTDTLGSFALHFLTGGESLKDVRVLISKQGYAPFDTLISRLDNNLKDWIIGLQKL